jgi:integrase
MKYQFKSLFAGRINGMLEYRSALGRSIVSYRWDLASFDRFCMRIFPGESKLTKELAFAWCGETPGGGRYRAHAVRGFARYLASTGETAYVIPPSFFPAKKADLPYIFSESELSRFFQASDRFPQKPAFGIYGSGNIQAAVCLRTSPAGSPAAAQA